MLVWHQVRALEAKLILKVGEQSRHHILEVGKKFGFPWTLYTRAPPPLVEKNKLAEAEVVPSSGSI